MRFLNTCINKNQKRTNSRRRTLSSGPQANRTVAPKGITASRAIDLRCRVKSKEMPPHALRGLPPFRISAAEVVEDVAAPRAGPRKELGTCTLTNVLLKFFKSKPGKLAARRSLPSTMARDLIRTLSFLGKLWTMSLTRCSSSLETTKWRGRQGRFAPYARTASYSSKVTNMLAPPGNCKSRPAWRKFALTALNVASSSTACINDAGFRESSRMHTCVCNLFLTHSDEVETNSPTCSSSRAFAEPETLRAPLVGGQGTDWGSNPYSL